MNVDYCFVGWYYDGVDRHDKVWGVIQLGPTRYLTFWGRRGRKLQTKILYSIRVDVNRTIGIKERKGYRRIDRAQLDTVYPEFETDLQKTAVWALLCR